MYRLPYPRTVSTLAYVVQPGDSVESITAQFVDERRWPELVAANQLHKRLVPAKGGSAYLVFESLEPNEQLFIPGNWPVPSRGMVGCGSGGCMVGACDPTYCSQPGFGRCNCGCGMMSGPYSNISPTHSLGDIWKGGGSGQVAPGYSNIGLEYQNPGDIINQPDPNQIPPNQTGNGAPGAGQGWYVPGGIHTQPGAGGSGNGAQTQPGAGGSGSGPGDLQVQQPGGHGGVYVPINPGNAPVFDPFAAVPAAIAAAMPAVQVLINQTQPGWQLPTPYQPIDVGNVIAGWLPYLPGIATPTGAQPTTPPTPWPTDPTKWDPAVLMRLVQQAAALLQMAGLQPTDVFTRIPWDQIPWGTFPWQSLPPDWWLIFAKVPGSPPREPPFIINDTGTQAMSLATNNMPNVLTINLGPTGPLGDVKWDGINPGLDPVLMQDPRIQACIAADGGTARLAAMVAKKDCFIGASADKILKYLCKNPVTQTYENLDSACQSEQVCQAGTQYDPTTGACVPTVPGKLPDWYSQINWACPTPPQCWFDQIAAKVPEAQRCPPPGSAWPACVPEWLQQQYGMQLPTIPGQTQPPAQTEPKADNTNLYIGLGIGAVVLLGGAAWLLAQPSGAAPAEQASPNPVTFKQYAAWIRREYPGRYTKEQIQALYNAKLVLDERKASRKPASRAR